MTTEGGCISGLAGREFRRGRGKNLRFVAGGVERCSGPKMQLLLQRNMTSRGEIILRVTIPECLNIPRNMEIDAASLQDEPRLAMLRRCAGRAGERIRPGWTTKCWLTGMG